MLSTVDQDWLNFLKQENNYANATEHEVKTPFPKPSADAVAPDSKPLFISTQTKCLYLSEPIDIDTIFWKLPIQEYWVQQPGVVKKQKKMVCHTPAEYDIYVEKLAQVDHYYEETIIKMIDNIDHAPEGQNTRVLKKKWAYKPPAERAEQTAEELYVKSRLRVKYKNERKLTIGMSKKDILNARKKKKAGAFYNCFALIVRYLDGTDFSEFHVKIFNTGKLEIPGRFSESVLEQIKQMILDLLQPYFETPLTYISGKDGVLINSNFHCGYVIDRDEFFQIIRNKYGIESSYNSSSYQGVKCKFYFNNELGFEPPELQTGLILEKDAMKMKDLVKTRKYTKIAFMVFRTGSCILVGNCSQEILYFLYDFLVRLLKTEFPNIAVLGNSSNSDNASKKIEPAVVIKRHAKKFFIG